MCSCIRQFSRNINLNFHIISPTYSHVRQILIISTEIPGKNFPRLININYTSISFNLICIHFTLFSQEKASIFLKVAHLQYNRK